jgi:hypothetical protein
MTFPHCIVHVVTRDDGTLMAAVTRMRTGVEPPSDDTKRQQLIRQSGTSHVCMHRWLHNDHMSRMLRRHAVCMYECVDIVDPGPVRPPIPANVRAQLWNDAPTIIGFDPDTFRVDVLGGIVCRQCNRWSPDRLHPLACDIDHVIPHTHGGESTPDNLALMAAHINRWKSNVLIFLLSSDLKHRLQNMIWTPQRVRTHLRVSRSHIVTYNDVVNAF